MTGRQHGRAVVRGRGRDGILLVDGVAARPGTMRSLGARYLAASAVSSGIPVWLYHPGPGSEGTSAHALASAVAAHRPALVGLTLYTETALPAYHLLAELGPRPGQIRVAGGPHATACPEEALAHGFDVVVLGEGEATLVELFHAVRRGTDLGQVAGLAFRDAAGQVRRTPPRRPPLCLDRLPSPEQMPNLDGSSLAPDLGTPLVCSASLVTSRGCPGRCSFCASRVSGRRYRFHSAERVLGDMRALHERQGTTAFFFHDDAFTAYRPRLLELCARMAELPFRVSWLCEARADQLDDERARAMARAGCTAVIVGVESGDPGVLRRIRKGLSLATAERALCAVRDAGMRAHANFMLGFPDETPAELDNTSRFMQHIAPWVDSLGVGGIVIPYPGTRLYQQHHHSCGFTHWWLDQARMARLHAVALDGDGMQTWEDVVALARALESAVLDAHIIPYSKGVREAIERCLEFRRGHALQAMQARSRRWTSIGASGIGASLDLSGPSNRSRLPIASCAGPPSRRPRR